MFFKNSWYAVALSAAVQTAPSRVVALGQPIVLYRRACDGRVVALSDVCVHRRASLSLGAVVGDELRCPYHGWTYGPDGRCTAVPANPPGAPISSRARVACYPVEERYGLVWVFWGDATEAERPPLPPFPEFGAPGWRAVWGEYEWKAHYTRVVENTVDVAHTPFVHARSFGNTRTAVMPPYEVSVSERALTAALELEAPEPQGLSRLVMGRGAKNTLDLGIYLPNVNRLVSSLGSGWRIALLISHLPVDATTTRSFFVQLRDFFTFPLADGVARGFTRKIMDEDRPTVESQLGPVTLRAGEELSTPSDRLGVEYRRALQRWIEAGWAME